MKTLERAPTCNICGNDFEADDPDEVIVCVKPMYLETSKKSGRLRMIELEFNFKQPDLEGYDYLLWHYKCLVEELGDPAVIGYAY